MTYPSMHPQVMDVYPVQWEGVMDNGLLYFEENACQSHARALPRPLREIRVKSAQWLYPFVIPVPIGAKPTIYQIGCIAVEMSNDPDARTKNLPFEFVFGWEKEIAGEMHYSLWKFGAGDPVYHEGNTWI